MKLKYTIKYWFEKFSFLKIYFSPFKRPKIRLYIGKIAIGTPYFYPRKWVKDKTKPGYLKAVPRKIGFDIVALGWKTKFGSIRYQWNPIWSFVFFGYQIALIFHRDEYQSSGPYWESWLYYEYYTDKKLSKQERVQQCIKEAPQTWTMYSKDDRITTDYYTLILKELVKLH